MLSICLWNRYSLSSPPIIFVVVDAAFYLEQRLCQASELFIALCAVCV